MNENAITRSARKLGYMRLQTVFSEFFGLNRAMATIASIAFALALLASIYFFIRLAPPASVTITSGPEGSVYQRNAQKYRDILARDGVTLKILPSHGSKENLERLNDPAAHVDIGFVQGGIADEKDAGNLVSLGSLYTSPVMIFYRRTQTVQSLSEFAGRRIAVGEEGSGLHVLASALLAANGIVAGGSTILMHLDAEDSATALMSGRVEAIFLMSESAPPKMIRTLMQTPGIQAYDFSQADAYTRRMPYLNKLVLPRGAMDFGKNIPPLDIALVGPTVELVARPGLHPALSDLLLEAATEIHGKAGLYKKQGEFPAPLEHEFSMSKDALRYYKSGKGIIYDALPYWLASVVSRVLVVFLPAILVLIPVVRSVPAIYSWKVRLGIFRWYRSLLAIEQDLLLPPDPDRRKDFLERLAVIESAVNKMKVPASFADQFYVLRGHIHFVRERLRSMPE